MAKGAGGGRGHLRGRARTAPASRGSPCIGELRDAIARRQLVLHYQPGSTCAPAEPCRRRGAGALAAPPTGPARPDGVHGAGRGVGHHPADDPWVLPEGRRPLATLAAAGHASAVAVNLSVRNLYDPDLLAVTWPTAARRLRAPAPSDLVLRAHRERADGRPRAWPSRSSPRCATWACDSIDDFGTGYSSLSYLRDLPVTRSRSTVVRRPMHGAGTSHDRPLGDRPGPQPGAPRGRRGRRERRRRSSAARLGCDRAQGYHLARPMPLDDLRGGWTSAGPSRRRPPARTA